ncbi:unnamed protein product [Pieris macdunnoughi]|uniref:Uncharacterized protein n=1 Tax=Pieris macdunnoughi TaxID=345717 RepID=A0A821QFF4_9NEOP|nr:unnamed protein product [Pieris macdunnoughi]
MASLLSLYTPRIFFAYILTKLIRPLNVKSIKRGYQRGVDRISEMSYIPQPTDKRKRRERFSNKTPSIMIEPRSDDRVRSLTNCPNKPTQQNHH